MIKNLIFDLDDTLYPEKEYNISGFKAVSEYLELTYHTNAMFEKFLALYFNGQRHNIFNCALKDVNLSITSVIIDELVSCYRNHQPEIFLTDEIESELIYYRDCGYKLGLITDGYSVVQHKKIEALNLEKYFNHIVVTDDYGRECWKPSLFPFELIMRKMDDENFENYVYVGDNCNKDFKAPNILKWKTIQSRHFRGFYSEENNCDKLFKAKYVVDKLLEIRNYI